jgi:integrase
MGKGLFKRGNIWWLRYSDGNGKIIRESSKTTSYRDAETQRIKRKKDIRDGNEPEPIKKIQNYTFNQLAEEYLKWCERQRSFRSKRGFLVQLVKTFGHYRLRQLTTQLLEQFQTERINKGNKPATVNRLIATLKHCVNKGYQWEMLSEQTFKRVKQVKLLEENNRRLRYLSKEECQILLSKCDNHIRPIVLTALHSGCRKGEILNLKWDNNVDLKHGFILLDFTKNGERREIPISDTLKQELNSLTRRLDVPHVFYDIKTGKPYKDIKRSFKTAVKRAKIHDFKFHDLRHTFASHLIMAGVDITTVSRLLGHKSLTMTLRYAHLAPSHMANAVSLLDSALNEVTQKVHNPRKKELTING